MTAPRLFPSDRRPYGSEPPKFWQDWHVESAGDYHYARDVWVRVPRGRWELAGKATTDAAAWALVEALVAVEVRVLPEGVGV